jgi:uncharacterized protein YegL
MLHVMSCHVDQPFQRIIDLQRGQILGYHWPSLVLTSDAAYADDWVNQTDVCRYLSGGGSVVAILQIAQRIARISWRRVVLQKLGGLDIETWLIWVTAPID